MQQLRFSQLTGKVTDVTVDLFRSGNFDNINGPGADPSPRNRFIGMAYSGNGEGLNNPAMEGVINHGVIPAGRYAGQHVEDPSKGPRVFRLTRMGTDKYGRGGFMIHWDTPLRNYQASDGCIVPMSGDTFSKIQDQFELEVVADA